MAVTMLLHRAHLHSLKILQRYTISITTRSASIHKAITLFFRYFTLLYPFFRPSQITFLFAVTLLHRLPFYPISSSDPIYTFYYHIFDLLFFISNDDIHVTDRLNLFLSYS